MKCVCFVWLQNIVFMNSFMYSFGKSVPFCKLSEVLCYFGVGLCYLCVVFWQIGPCFQNSAKAIEKKKL